MDYGTILYETDGGKARITLNRPDKLNAISWQMQQELRDALWAADRDPHVHVAILRGASRVFSSGYDITPPPGEATHAASAHSMERDIWHLEQAQQMRMALWDMHKPVIGQVHGYCLAGGTDLVFLCDIVLAAEDARIGFPPVRAMGLAGRAHVDVPRRAAVGQAHAADGRHDLGQGSRARRLRA
jgi:enoyl-CoA hydratase